MAKYTPRVPGYYARWRRIRDNWHDSVEHGGNPMWGTVHGRFYMAGVLTELEASAGTLYAEVVGRYNRYHPIREPHIRGTPQSPAYQIGFGKDDEIEKLAKDRTGAALKRYEKRARSAQRVYEKLQRCLPTGAREVIERVLIYDQEIPSAFLPQYKHCMGLIGRRFTLGNRRAEAREDTRKTRGDLPKNVIKQVRQAIDGAAKWFKEEDLQPKFFRLVGDDRSRGIVVYCGPRFDDEHPIGHTVTVRRKKGVLAAHLDSVFLQLAVDRGWVEDRNPPSGGERDAGEGRP